MKRNRNVDGGRAQTPTLGRDDHGDGGAMSPTMRQLILTFVKKDSERTWDPGAYARPSAPAARP